MSAPVRISSEDIVNTRALLTLVDDNHDAIIYDPTFNWFAPGEEGKYYSQFHQGSPTISIEFVGYVLQYSNPDQPIIYPLYLKRQLFQIAYLETPMLHSSAFELAGFEVLLFAVVLQAMKNTLPCLNLWWVRGRTGIDTVLHSVYHYMDVAHAHEPEVKVNLVEYPFGYYVRVIPDVDASNNGSTILQTTWIGSSVMTLNTPHTTGVQPRPKKVSAAHSLHQIMEMCPNWRRVLALLRMLLRVAICCGHSDNPYLLVNVEFSARRLELIRSVWPECLLRANVTSESLETVLTKITQVPMSHNDVLALASPWITQFMYDNRRVVVNSMDDPRIFGLGNFFGLAQREIIVDLLRMFLRPYVHTFPIELNGFAAFLMLQIAKELVYHMIFRTTSTSRIRFTIADLEPATFRTVANPPVDTLALAGSSCYQALLVRLLSLYGANEAMPDYPSVAQIYSELRKTAIMLLQQENDPSITRFRAELRQLCVITVKNSDNTRYNLYLDCLPDTSDSAIMTSSRFNLYMACAHTLNSTSLMAIALMAIGHGATRLHAICHLSDNTSLTGYKQTYWKFQQHPSLLYNVNMPNISSTCETTYKTNFLGIEQNETALLAWLQTEGRDTLPDSLLTTASMLFGWVDTHDIMALLDVSLREVTMQTQLQQEEDMSYTGFRSQGACLMEDRMHRAQMEISLFSNAIANLCEYLETRNYPISTQKPSTVNTITYVEACPELIPIRFDHFEPSKVIQDKCNAWLHVPSHFPNITQADSNATGILGSPKAVEISLMPDDQFLSLPRSLKTWVDNVTYCAYMSATFAEAKPLFKAKEQKTPEVLKSDIYILGLKKQRAQSEVDMHSEAISRISEFGDDVTSSGSAMTHASFAPDNYIEDGFDDWVSTSYASSDVELL
ncbi:hypothetical protein C8R48DRAFT_674356 [Suillus tomentosus]|nr:hypothetical protein C8R48DRAFT_674356 [Suillus tomentosus]